MNKKYNRTYIRNAITEKNMYDKSWNSKNYKNFTTGETFKHLSKISS